MEYGQAFFWYIAAIKLFDALTVLAVWYAAWFLRFHSSLFPTPKGVPDFAAYQEVALPLVLVFSAVFHMVGVYRRDRIEWGFRPLKKLSQGSVLAVMAFISFCYFLDKVHFSRLYLAVFPFLVIFGLVLERLSLHLVWETFRRYGVRPIRFLLVGHGELLSMWIEKIKDRMPYPIIWVGQLSHKPLTTVPHLGDETQLKEIVRREKIDRVVVSYPSDEENRYHGILSELANELIAVKVIPDFGRFTTFTYQAEQECGIPVLLFNDNPMSNSDRFLKRLVDIVGSLLFLVVFSPVYLALALAVKLTSRGPVFYSQKRVGADGNVFTLYKFRSMRTDAEKSTGAVWAVPGDNRTTGLGKWLRKTSLDEIPQFYNVLCGDMSLVGPRPERPEFVSQFRDDVPKYMLRHRVKSGITGWAQINGWRGNTSIEQRIKHDLYYIGHWSHLFDIKILCLTLWKGFNSPNAY